jgi:hypothetical protein
MGDSENVSVYEDYKYTMQDVSRVYVGCKYTFGELLENEEVLFKLRLVVQKYILPQADAQDTLESHLYYLEAADFLAKLYGQMKARIKVNVIEEKRGLFGRGQKRYVTKLLTIEQLTAMSPAEKEAVGLVIQELSVSKLALMGL